MILKNVRLSALIVKAFWLKEKKVILVSSVVGVSFFLVVFKLLPYIPRPKMTQRIGLVGNVTFDDLPDSITSPISSGLTKITADGTALPSLAEKWRSDDSGKKYTFYLSNNIYWQDGTGVTSKDIQYDLPGVKTTIITDKIITYDLPEPYAPFPTVLSSPAFKDKYIGTGKYEIKSITNNASFIRKLFLVGPDKNILYTFYPTTDAVFRAFKAGEIDKIQNLHRNELGSDWDRNIKVSTKINNDQYIALFFNLRNKDLSSKTLRQALSYATPKPEDQTRALGPLNPTSWAYNPDIKPYLADATQAKNLMEKYKAEEKPGDVSLTIDTTANFLSLAEEIGKSWHEILSIDTQVQLVDRVPDDFQTLLIITQIPADPDQYTFWHSTQKGNLTGYKSPKVDKALEDGRINTDVTVRQEKYFDFQRFLLEDCPAIFISYPQVFEVSRKKILTNLW